MNDHDHYHDQPLADYLRSATADLAPDVPALVAGGLARGRARRRRRRTQTTLAAVVVFGVIGAAASVTHPWAGGRDPAIGIATDPSSIVADPDPTGASPTPAPTPAPPAPTPSTVATTPVPGTEIPALWASVHPGEITEQQPLEDGPGEQIAHFLWEGFFTSAGVTARTADTPPPLRWCRRLNSRLSECVAHPDGTVTSQWQSTADGVTARGFSLYDDRGEVWVISYNGAEGKDVVPLAPEPPFSFTDLEEVVRAPGWWR